MGRRGGRRASTPITREKDGSYAAPIRILRIHMEEDAAKMVHVGGEEGRITAATEKPHRLQPLRHAADRSWATEPDLRTPEEARLFMEKLQQSVQDARHLRLLAGERLYALRRQHRACVAAARRAWAPRPR